MNTRPKNPANARNLNACVIGSSGSGKTRFWLTPQLLQASAKKKGGCSYVVRRSKRRGALPGGGFPATAGLSGSRCSTASIFPKSMHYNPLSYIRNEADILKFVDTLIANTKGEGKEGDPFWTKAETLLVLRPDRLYHFRGPRRGSEYQYPGGHDFRHGGERGRRVLYERGGLYVQGPGKAQAGLLCGEAVQEIQTGQRQDAPKAFLISCGSRLAPFDIPQLREIMSYDELALVPASGIGKRRFSSRISDTNPNLQLSLWLWPFRRNGLPNPTHFTDDGISGTRFDRPGFLAMMEEVEAGRVEAIVIKDMSRLGRDYLKVGQVMEVLRQRGVRLIAINDGVDSLKGDDDFTPFRNIMNEFYARDTSRKIRSVFKSKGMSGKHLTGTVIYGYLWDEKREHWLVDEEAAEVVRRIFSLTLEGYGPYQIACKLSTDRIEIPVVHLARFNEGVNRSKPVKDPYGWGSSTIVNILKKREYLGHTINFKTRKHFKDKKSHYVSEDEWTIFENTHEAIIDQQTFDLAQKIRSNVRRYPNGWGEAAPLTGLLYCADCGGKMYVHRTNNGKRVSQYTCSNYTKVPCGTLCPTQHRINESAVLTLASDTLRAIAEYFKNDRTEFIHTVQETQVAQQSADISKKRRRLAVAQKRAGELEKLICKIYEDNALGKLPDARYRALDAQYAKEQDALEIEIAELEKAVTGYEQSQKSAEKFIALIDKYENFDTLTNTMLNEFVEKILVHERARKGSQDTTQEIEIYFNFLGRYIPPSLQPVPLTPEEQEELQKKEERKDRLHQNYLKRKASGAQKQYEDKIKAKKKAEMDAKKALIRAEDMKKGIFSTVGQLPKEEPRKGSIAASAAV